jgi:predicted nucleotidyltransferase
LENEIAPIAYFCLMKNSAEIKSRLAQLGKDLGKGTELILFGSQARGSATIDSDWDVLVLLQEEPITFERETQVMDIFYTLELETGEVFSPIVYSKSDWKSHAMNSPLFNRIQKEGQPLPWT